MAENEAKQEINTDGEIPSEEKIDVDGLQKTLKDKDKFIEERENEINRLTNENIKLKEQLRKEGDILNREADRKLQKEKGKLIKEFLEVLDNFERAISSLSEGETDSLQGLLLIKNQIDTFLKEQGVQEMELEGKEFDPALCEIGEVVQTDSVEPNKILKIMRKGYYLKDNILRTAVVSVAVPEQTQNTDNGGV